MDARWACCVLVWMLIVAMMSIYTMLAENSIPLEQFGLVPIVTTATLTTATLTTTLLSTPMLTTARNTTTTLAETAAIATVARTGRYGGNSYFARPRLGSEHLFSPLVSATPFFLWLCGPNLPHAAFNPSVVKLPKWVVAAINPKAYFVAALRHNGDQCGNLGAASWIMDRGVRGVNGLRGGRAFGTSILLLDRGFRPCGGGPLLRKGRLNYCVDARLSAIGDKVFVDCSSYGDHSAWHLFELGLSITGSGAGYGFLKAEMKDYIPAGAKGNIEIQNARNLGLLLDHGRLSLIFWASSPKMDVRDLLLQAPQRSVEFLHKWHNNGNTERVPYTNLMLGAAHDHESTGAALWGSKYMHFFFLFEPQEPYTMVARSEFFCFPAQEDATKCELIQFISSLTIDEDDKDLSVVVGYGINDCEAALRRMPLQAVLDFVWAGANRQESLELEAKMAVRPAQGVV